MSRRASGGLGRFEGSRGVSRSKTFGGPRVVGKFLILTKNFLDFD